MRKFNILKPILAVVLLVSTTLLILPSFKSNAGALAAAYLYLSRIEANVSGSGETVEMVLAIDTGQTIPTSGTITFTFPDADDGMWCRTNGGLTVSGVATSAADQASTNWAIDSAVPGTLTASCTKGVGVGTVDTIIISSVGVLTAGTTYGVKLSNNTGILGTDDTTGEHEITIEAKSGATIDSSTFKVYLIANDTVVVSATVSSVPSVNCSISTNAVNLGSLYPGGSYATGTHTISTSTSTTTAGYYWAAYGTGDGSTDAGLYKASATTDLLASTGSTTVVLTAVDSEGFGMTLSDPDTAGAAVVATDFSDASAGTFGALDRLPAGAQLILYQNGSQSSAENSTVTYGARAASAAQAGSYSESVFFVCGGYY